MTNYRCRLHPDRSVTWRGTGCRTCARDAEEAAHARHEAERQRRAENRRLAMERHTR
jgi:hypothetical protein